MTLFYFEFTQDLGLNPISFGKAQIDAINKEDPTNRKKPNKNYEACM